MTKYPALSPFEVAVVAANAAEAKKSLNTRILEVNKISSVADYFVLCTGESTVQLKAIADAVQEAMDTLGYKPIGQERDRIGKWTLLDFGEIVVHVMHPQARDFYRIEDFWNHATPIAREQWLREERQAS